MSGTAPDWQSASIQGLERLTTDHVPAVELLYLDALAVHLLGPEAPEPPYTLEHGTAIVGLLLQAVANAPLVVPELEADPAAGADETHDVSAVARAAVADGAQRLASRGGPGVHRVATRFLTAAVGELEQHAADPESQVRSLFYFGLLAIASGPENQTNAEVADGILAAFHRWDQRIGEGYVPPWRVVAGASG